MRMGLLLDMVLPLTRGREIRPLLVAAATAALGLAVLSPAPAPARELSAADIVARNVTARGGLEAWRKVQTMVWMGHIQSAHAPVPVMQFKLEQKRPNKTRLELNAFGDRTLRVFDGVRGWKLRPVRGRADVQPYTLQEVRYAQAGHGIDGPLIDQAVKGDPVTLESVDEIGGRKAYHLKLHLARGGDEDVWVDTETYLDVRHDRMANGLGGTPRRVSTMYGDYRNVEGLQVPFLIETGGGPGTTPDKMQIETVVVNAPLDDATFGNPAASHQRSRARPGFAPGAPLLYGPSATRSTAPTAAGEERGAAPQ